MANFELSPQQRAIVEHRGGTLLVSAAAGSGKTRVLVERLMGFVCTEGANVDDFLIITYTRAAASELRSRIAAELSERLSEHPNDAHLRRQLLRVHSAQISTVHAFCSDLLRESAHLVDLNADFRVMEQDTADQMQERAADQTLEEAYRDPDSDRLALFETLGAGRDDGALKTLILNLYAQSCCHRNPEEWAKMSCDRYLLDETEDAAATPWGRQMIRRMQKMLEESADALERACRRMYGDPVLEKNYLPVFSQNVQTIRRILEVEDWNGIHSLAVPDWGKLKSSKGCADKELAEYLKSVRKKTQDKIEKALLPFAVSQEEALEDLRKSGAAIRALFALTEDFRERYAAEKARIGALDFSDLEQHTLRLLYRKDGKPTETAKELSLRWREIMVDEYQDSNQVQEAIFAALERPEGNRFLVGDVKQSIYRFRLADPTIFLEKYRRFPLAEEGETRRESKLLLSTNYRSRPEILDAVNDVFRGIMSEDVGELEYGEDEALLPGRPSAEAESPSVELHVIDPSDDEEETKSLTVEAAFVAERIAQLLQNGTVSGDDGSARPIEPKDIVILLRAAANAAPAYLKALTKCGIPAGYESSDDLLLSEEVQLLRSMMQVIDNPRQDIPLTAVLLSPVWGYHVSDLALMRAESKETCLYEALTAHREKNSAFLQELERLRGLRPALSLEELTQELLVRMDLNAFMEAHADAAGRKQKFSSFLQIICSASSEGKSLQQFLQELDEMEERDQKLSAPSSVVSGVQIRSIHSSKGLEFPIVFLPDLSRKMNLKDLSASLLTHPEWGVAADTVNEKARAKYPTIAKMALRDVKEREAKSEEERILYVGMTRARERLIMSCCDAHIRSRLSGMLQDAEYPVPSQTVAAAVRPSDWILQTAVTRMDAGQLHLDGNRPSELRVPSSNWRIEFHENEQYDSVGTSAPNETAVRISWPESLDSLLTQDDAGRAASSMPAKLTATQLKGRFLDEELSDGEPWDSPPLIRFPKPDFAGVKTLTASERGTAMHLFMQYADFGKCSDREGISQEIQRLEEEKYLTHLEAQAVNGDQIEAFFSSGIGRRIREGRELVREFKFSVLMPADLFDPMCAGEEVLLQGVVDCFLNEPDGLTVIDFKTDRLKPGEEPERADYYRGQLFAYSNALAKIYGKPVKKRYLWFFATSAGVQIL
ncbi:MAG: helicase-exonuclease AddAB subunit AddA [Oscillospiraceae bacterium]|nr:helicase-exonuclease AddAB subunit AddA [Oscillospiraceae bacterium]